MIKTAKAAAAALAALALTACISDSDIPYPDIQANITAFEVEGQTRPALIDTINRTVTIALNDSVNPASLRVERFTLAPGASMVTDTAVITSGINLTEPLSLTLKVYREYVWTISANRTVTRAFAVDGQIGPSVIDADAHTVSASIASSADIKAVKVTELKLEGATATYSPDILGSEVDFSEPVTVSVTEYGVTTDWTITLTTTDLAVDLASVDPWTCVAWLNASVSDGARCRFEYRPAGSDAPWTAAPSAWATDAGNGSIICRLVHLTPSTSYEARAVDIDTDIASPAITFTTDQAPQAPNSDFSQWWLDGKIWCPWSADGDPYWGTGNKGATTLGDSNTTPIASQLSPPGLPAPRSRPASWA